MKEEDQDKQNLKPWQNGFPLEVLRKIEMEYDKDYNQYSLSPFSRMKKNNVAEFLHRGELYKNGSDYHVIQEVKIKSPISMFRNIKLGDKLPGDLVISYINGSFCNYQFDGKPIWVICWAENATLRTEIENSGYRYIGGKITTFGEIYSIYFREGNNVLESRSFPIIAREEFVPIMKIGNVDQGLVEEIAKKVKTLNYANHYSNYNNNDSWSAISLRGYSPNPLFITKPAEMNDKWKKEHENEHFELQDTELRKQFPEVDELLQEIFGKQNEPFEVHRIRFMKLRGGDGDLGRHTDIVDPDSGKYIGKLLRFHFPIITNPDVTFTAWHSSGFRIDEHMKIGECWILDTRYPHMVVNKGKEDRIHLVVDIIINKTIYGMLPLSQ